MKSEFCKKIKMVVYKYLLSICVYLVILNIKDCWGIGAVRLMVEPSVVYKGGSATLRCERDLKGEPLYAVKWYRGNYEFYRYSPAEHPNTKVFSLPRIYVDLHQSNETQVVLRKLELGLTGNFSCEVTADAPSFSTQVVSKFINIYALPEGAPVLQAEHRSYMPGDVLRANCTAPPARPAVNLTMLLNGEIVASSETRLFQNDAGLQWSDINLLVHLTPAHFNFGRLRLVCIASLDNLYLDKNNLEFFSSDTDPKPARITSSSAGSLFNLDFSVRLLMLIFLLLMVFFKEARGFDYIDGFSDSASVDNGFEYSLYDSSEYDDNTINSLVGA